MATTKPKKTSKKPKKTSKSRAGKSREATFDEFSGFPKELFAFLKELEKNNDREWFQANKSRYERDVKAPLEAFLSDVEDEVGPGKVFRIHRDVRFSKDKSPYKTHASVVFERAGSVYYLHLEKDHLFCATGYYMMQKDQLARFYEAVVSPKVGAQLEKLVQAAEAKELEIGGAELKNVARGYDKEHPRARLLKHKGLTISRTWRSLPKWVHHTEVGTHVLEAWRQSAALNAWLQEHVGPSEAGQRFVR